MKKSLIALAALSAFATAAQAQSSVTVYGTLDIGVGQTKATITDGEISASRKTSTTGNGDGGLSTSIIGFRGTEDLGGGLKANFNLEYDLMDAGSGGQDSSTAPSGASTNAGFGSRLSWVGLESAKAGQVRLGRQFTASHGIIAGFSAGMANNTVGAVYSAGTAQITGTDTLSLMPNEAGIRPHQVFANRVITYITPSLNGLVGTFQYGENTQQISGDLASDKTKLTFNDMALRYTAGKLDIGVSRQVNKATSSDNGLTEANVNTVWGTSANNFFAAGGGADSAKATTTMLGASYDFGVVRPFALHTEKKVAADNNTAKQKATELGLRAPLTQAVIVFASTYDGELKSSFGLEKLDLSGYQLGATYAMSKRTTAYAIMGQQKAKNEDGSAKVTGTSVGVRHAF